MGSHKRQAVLFSIAMAALAVTVLIWRAKAQTVINAGYDQFSTPANAVTQETLSLPAGALTNAGGASSLPFNGQITFQGGPPVSGYTGDTVIERTQNVTVPGGTPLSVYGINLVSVGTVPIEFSDNTSVNYSVSVSQSSVTASTGTMNFTADGNFTNNLSVNVQYTFSAPGEMTTTIDAASIGIPAIAFSSSGQWQADGSGGTDIRRMSDDASTHGPGNPGGGGSSPAGVNITVVPNTEQAILASHGIGPAPSPTPTPIPTPTPQPTANPCSSSSSIQANKTDAVIHPCDDSKHKFNK